MPAMQPGPAPSSPAAMGSSFRNPRPDSADQEGTAESHAGDENEVRIASSELPVAGPDETEPQKSEETGSRGAAEHKVETTSMASSTEAMAKGASLCAAHPDVSEPSVPCFGIQLSPDLQPASVVISSEPSRTKDADEQASPASLESAGIQPQASALSAEGLSKSTRRPSIPVLLDGMDTLTSPAHKIGVLDWAVAEPLHLHYETAQAIKLPPRSEWWVHEKEASERRVEALEARLRSAQAAQDPVVEWNLHRLEDTLDSPCDESRASPKGIPLPQMEQAFHDEEGLEAAATALLRSAADEEWSRPRGAGTSGHMYPTTDDDWAAPLFSPSSRRNESRTAQSSLLDPAAEAPSAGPIPSWIYRGVGAVPLPPRPVSATAGSTGSTGAARKPLEALDDQLQHLLLLQEQQLQRQMQLQEHQCRLQEMQLQQQEQQLEAQQRERERQERLDTLREQQRQFDTQRKMRPPESPSVAAQLPYHLQQQQQQQEMLNHILLLHQSAQLQQLRQVQTEQDRHLRDCFCSGSEFKLTDL